MIFVLLKSFLIFLSYTSHHLNAFLMFPPNATNLSLVSSVSVPVTEYFPERRIIVDWCFVMTYNLPSSPSQFYNVAIWPVKPKYRRDLLPESFNYTQNHSFEKYGNEVLRHKRHSMDFTAGELYEKIEDFLVNYGFHETCLLRAVCELARHPFDDRHQNIITDVITFFLTPSLHEGFDEKEQLYKEVYEQAEEQGFYGEDCEQLYADCKQDFLLIISKIIFSKE